MDFIPKSLMNDVKSLKKQFQKKNKAKEEPRLSNEPQSEEALGTPEDCVRSVLTSANRKSKTLDEIVLPESKERFKTASDKLMEMSRPIETKYLSIATKSPLISPMVTVCFLGAHT